MKKIVLVALAMMGFTVTANAQGLGHEKYEMSFQPLGLERAVNINGTPCLMTTPYDTHARCGTTRVDLRPCAFPALPAFVDGNLVCDTRAQRPPTVPLRIRR